MCRNIKTLFNYNPVASDDEIYASALQYVRKVSGFRQPSQINKDAFDTAVDLIANTTRELIQSLQTNSPPRNREIEIEKMRERSRKRYATG